MWGCSRRSFSKGKIAGGHSICAWLALHAIPTIPTYHDCGGRMSSVVLWCFCGKTISLKARSSTYMRQWVQSNVINNPRMHMAAAIYRASNDVQCELAMIHTQIKRQKQNPRVGGIHREVQRERSRRKGRKRKRGMLPTDRLATHVWRKIYNAVPQQNRRTGEKQRRRKR